MTGFSRRVVGLQEVFPSSGIAVAQPSEVSESVSLVHRWPSAKASLDRVERGVFVSASALTPALNVLIVPQGRWMEILFGDVSHDSATNRAIQMLVQVAGQNFFLGRWTTFSSVLAALGPSGFEPLFSSAVASQSGDRILPTWPLVLPPGSILQFVGDTAVAPWAITVGVVLVSHPLAEDSALSG